MFKALLFVALLAGAFAANSPVKSCDTACKDDKACTITKCDLRDANPGNTCTYPKMLTGGYQITAGGPCKCQSDGTCADWGTPNPTCMDQYKANKECIVKPNDAATYEQFGDLCALSATALQALEDADNITTCGTDNTGVCVIGGCFKDTEKLKKVADSGFDLEEFEFRWVNPADPLFYEQNGVSALILERKASDTKLTVEVAHTPLPTDFGFTVKGGSGVTFTKKTADGIQTGFTLEITIPDNSKDIPVVQYGVPQISLADTVTMTVIEGAFYIVILPVLSAGTSYDKATLALTKKEQPDSTTSEKPTLGATAIPLTIGNVLIVDQVTCPSTAYIGVMSKVKDATKWEVEDVDFDNQNSLAYEFLWSRTDLAKDTEVTLTWICASFSAPLGLVDGLNYVTTSFTQLFKTGALPTAKALTAYDDPADFELFFAQLNQNTTVFRTVDIYNLLITASKKWNLVDAAGTTWTDPLQVSADTQRGVTRLLTLAAVPLEKLAGGTVECDINEANLIVTLLAMMDYADLSANGQALVDKLAGIARLYYEPCFADITPSGTKFGQLADAASRRSEKSKQTASTLTAAQKKTAELTQRSKQLKDFESLLEREVRRIADTPGTVYRFDSVDANKTKTGCYTGCVVRNPPLKKSLDGKTKDHSICSLVNGDSLTLKGIDENIKKNAAKYPKDAVVGFVKFNGKNACNYELAKDSTLKYEGSFHVFFFDGAKIPPKGATPPKKAAAKKAAAKIHTMRSRSIAVQQVNTTLDGKWAVYIKPASFAATSSQCWLRDQTSNVELAPSKVYTSADGCEVASDTAGPSVSRTIYVLPSAAPPAPTAPTAKSATRMALSLFTLLAVMVFFAIL